MSKIPPHATCVFKGQIFDTYQWQQELYDGTVTIFEMLKRPDTVVVLPLSGKSIYYSKQEQPSKPPFLSLFGGRVENGEQPLDAAKRELSEESGLTSPHWQHWKTFSSGGSKIEWNVHYFIARNCVKTEEPNLDGGEKIEIIKTTLKKFLNTVVSEENFAELELKQSLYSNFNPMAYSKIEQEFLGNI